MNRLRNLKISRKLSLLLFISIIFLIISGTIGVKSSIKIKERSAHVFDDSLYIFGSHDPLGEMPIA
jgi:hypothetical protein